MDLNLTDEQRDLQAMCHEFAEREIRPIAMAIDEADHEVPWAVLEKAAALGLTSFMLPEAYGGGGIGDLLTHCVVSEELCWGCSAIGSLIVSGGFFAESVLQLGTEEQRQRWIPSLCTTPPTLTSLATTEPGAGSDAAAITTTAVRTDGGYVVNGQKTWISNGGIAGLYLVFATVAPGTRSRGITAFVLEQGDAGLSWSAPMRKMGQRAIPTTEVLLADVRVDDDRRIGDEGQGFYGLMGTFDRSRITLAASEVGLARACVEYAVGYAKEREAFGKPIAQHQAVAFRLADADLKVEQARLLTHHAARLADAGKPVTKVAAMAKLAASEAAVFAADAAVQTLGGYGYSREYPVEKWYRDAKLEELWEGTSDIMRIIISRGLFA